MMITGLSPSLSGQQTAAHQHTAIAAAIEGGRGNRAAADAVSPLSADAPVGGRRPRLATAPAEMADAGGDVPDVDPVIEPFDRLASELSARDTVAGVARQLTRRLFDIII